MTHSLKPYSAAIVATMFALGSIVADASEPKLTTAKPTKPVIQALQSNHDHTPVGIAIKWSHQIAKAETVLLATDKNYADSYSSGALQGVAQAPLLLTEPTKLPQPVLNEMYRLGAKNVIILGGTKSVSPAIMKELKEAGFSVERISGPTRVETSVEIAKFIDSYNSDNNSTSKNTTPAENSEKEQTKKRQAVVIDGKDNSQFDALSAGSLAAKTGWPILINVETPGEPVHPAVAAYLADSKTNKVVVIGGTKAVSRETVSALIRSTAVQRWSGANRMLTAVNVAEHYPDHTGKITLVDGYLPPDIGWVNGIAASLASANINAPVILAQDDTPIDFAKHLILSQEEEGIIGYTGTFIHPLVTAEHAITSVANIRTYKEPVGKPNAGKPTDQPGANPSTDPSKNPSADPSADPSAKPSTDPSAQPSTDPSTDPSTKPSAQPSADPSSQPSTGSSENPSQPTDCDPAHFVIDQTCHPSTDPNGTPKPSPSPSAKPDPKPNPAPAPSTGSSEAPSENPSTGPTTDPSTNPSTDPSTDPSKSPSTDPSTPASENASESPTTSPSDSASEAPSTNPSTDPSTPPSESASENPSDPAVEELPAGFNGEVKIVETENSDGFTKVLTIDSSEHKSFLAYTHGVEIDDYNNWTVRDHVNVGEDLGIYGYVPKDATPPANYSFSIDQEEMSAKVVGGYVQVQRFEEDRSRVHTCPTSNAPANCDIMDDSKRPHSYWAMMHTDSFNRFNTKGLDVKSTFRNTIVQIETYKPLSEDAGYKGIQDVELLDYPTQANVTVGAANTKVAITFVGFNQSKNEVYFKTSGNATKSNFKAKGNQIRNHQVYKLNLATVQATTGGAAITNFAATSFYTKGTGTVEYVGANKVDFQ